MTPRFHKEGQRNLKAAVGDFPFDVDFGFEPHWWIRKQHHNLYCYIIYSCLRMNPLALRPV